MGGCLYAFLVLPFYLVYCVFVIFCYAMYYGIKFFIYACFIIYGMILEIIRSAKNNKTYNTRNNYKSADKKDIKILNFNKKGKNNIKFPYILVRIDKTAGRKIFDGSSINNEAFGVKGYDCPMTSVDFDDEKYYKVEIYEDYTNLSGKLIDAMFKKLKRKMTVEIGEDEKDVKYRYYYTDEGVMINSMSKSNISRINASLRSEYMRIKNGINNRETLDDNPDLIEAELKAYNIDMTDLYDVEDYLSDDYLIYEWFYIEQLLSVMKNIDLTVKSEPIVFERVIEYVDKDTFKGSSKPKRSSKTKKDKFDREADLWGLSKKDRRLAKEERMSPADYVEAEEYDDDELLKDDWER